MLLLLLLRQLRFCPVTFLAAAALLLCGVVAVPQLCLLQQQLLPWATEALQGEADCEHSGLHLRLLLLLLMFPEGVAAIWLLLLRCVLLRDVLHIQQLAALNNACKWA